MRIAVIGAGLAGTSCAYILKAYGFDPVIYEAGGEIAPGASGNPLGLYNPRLSARRTPESDFFSAAYALALRSFPELGDIEWSKCGTLHLLTDEKKKTRFRECVRSWGWHSDSMRLVSKEEGSAIAGIPVAQEALYLPDSGVVSPRLLCKHYAQSVQIHWNTKIVSLEDLEADAVILACGMGISEFPQTAHLPLKGVRGQITQFAANEVSSRLKCNLCYGGYVTPQTDGIHMTGSTFQRWLSHCESQPEDDLANLSGMAFHVPALDGSHKVTGSRASMRTTTPDHFPVAGLIEGHENLYVSTGHGSHGILSSLACAHLIADMISGRPRGLSSETCAKLSPSRYGCDMTVAP